jgi:hypothetical protein
LQVPIAAPEAGNYENLRNDFSENRRYEILRYNHYEKFRNGNSDERTEKPPELDRERGPAGARHCGRSIGKNAPSVGVEKG